MRLQKSKENPQNERKIIKNVNVTMKTILFWKKNNP